MHMLAFLTSFRSHSPTPYSSTYHQHVTLQQIYVAPQPLSFPDRTLCKFIILTPHNSTVLLLQCSLRRGEALFVIRRMVHQVCVLKKHLFQQIDVFIFIGTLFLNPVSRSLMIVPPDHSCLCCCSSPFVIFS